MYKYDAILIPGGGLTQHGELPIWTKRRIEKAIQIGSFRFVITLSAGTTHKPPPLDQKNFPILESVAAANYLLKKEIPAQQILTETSSYDTIGNAFFSRVIHIEPLDLKKLLVITSEFHMPRTKAIFLWVYGLSRNHNEYQLDFESVPDDNIDDDIISSRREKERKSLIKVEELKSKIKTFKDFHFWLFNEHKAYSIINDERSTLKGDALKSY